MRCFHVCRAFALLLASALSVSASEPVRIGSLDWHTSYAEAYAEAKAQKQMLCIYFQGSESENAAVEFRQNVLASPELAPPLKSVTRCLLPVDFTMTMDGQQKKLLSHSSFAHMQGRAGLAIVDLTDSKSPHFTHVVSAHPFWLGGYESAHGVRTILELPSGTLVQRALVYAVRTYPAMPPCTQGAFDPFLASSAQQNSQAMTSYGIGHHNWGGRLAEISSAYGSGATEVAAMSVSAGHPVDAARELIRVWHGSPAHWGLMSVPTRRFGFDMVQGPSGQWYGTGVFMN